MTAAGSEQRPQRRVGTFTLGVTLVAAGAAMLASWFWPGFQPQWLVNASPVILILLGIEVLIAAGGGGRVRYDWAGIILCFLITCAALAMYAAAWWFEANPYDFRQADHCSRMENETCYQMDYGYFNGYDSGTLSLKAGQVLLGEAGSDSGWLEVTVCDEDGETIWEQSPFEGRQRIEISRDGLYTVEVFGQRARGYFSFNVEG